MKTDATEFYDNPLKGKTILGQRESHINAPLKYNTRK